MKKVKITIIRSPPVRAVTSREAADAYRRAVTHALLRIALLDERRRQTPEGSIILEDVDFGPVDWNPGEHMRRRKRRKP